jgi:hypothetical protein
LIEPHTRNYLGHKSAADADSLIQIQTPTETGTIMNDAKTFVTGFVAISRYRMRARTHVAARLRVLIVNAIGAQASSAAYVL